MPKRTGVQMHSGHLAGGLFGRTLWRMAQSLPPTARVAPKEGGKERRAAAISAAGKKLDLTDAQVVEARRLHEEEGRSCTELAAAHDVPYGRMYQILNYQTRTFGV